MLIAVDDRTLARLHAPGNSGILRRAAYARMLERFREDGAAAIAIDVIFKGPQDPRNDRALLAAIRASRHRVVLATSSYNVGQGSVPHADLFRSPRDLSVTSTKTGFAGLPEDVDEGNRRADYQVKLSPTKAYVNTFAFATADVVRHGALDVGEPGDPTGEDPPQLPTASRRAQDEQSERTTWIDFRGPPGNIPRVSALEVLDGRVPPGTFSGKVLVVGKLTDNLDQHETPVDGDDRTAGPEVQANAIDTILRDSPLRDVSRPVEILAILALASIPALASLVRSRVVAAAAIAALAAAALYLLLAQLAFNSGWIVPVVVPLAALAASAACVAALAAARMARHGRARSGTAPGRSP
jgi:CHASE2 domain-containing sensor protein